MQDARCRYLHPPKVLWRTLPKCLRVGAFLVDLADTGGRVEGWRGGQMTDSGWDRTPARQL
jgi:hypothetical protein